MDWWMPAVPASNFVLRLLNNLPQQMALFHQKRILNLRIGKTGSHAKFGSVWSQKKACLASPCVSLHDPLANESVL